MRNGSLMKYCICKNQPRNSVFQPSEKLYFEKFFPGPTMVSPIVDLHTRECLVH